YSYGPIYAPPGFSPPHVRPMPYQYRNPGSRLPANQITVPPQPPAAPSTHIEDIIPKARSDSRESGYFNASTENLSHDETEAHLDSSFYSSSSSPLTSHTSSPILSASSTLLPHSSTPPDSSSEPRSVEVRGGTNFGDSEATEIGGDSEENVSANEERDTLNPIEMLLQPSAIPSFLRRFRPVEIRDRHFPALIDEEVIAFRVASLNRQNGEAPFEFTLEEMDDFIVKTMGILTENN
ncbi:hypothetical protein PENTCL1PPCAC_26083, partial [Pristionchus entomophagus]